MNIRQENTYRNAVMKLQRYLRQLQHEKEVINRVPIDGIFGDDTRDALIRFQNENLLPATGVADLVTWTLLFEEYQKSLTRNSSANGIFPFFDLPIDYELKLGDANTLVSVLEIILREISTEYTELRDVFVDNGIFDKTKSDIIYKYQVKNKLTPSGNVDRVTWNRLADDFNSIIRKNQ